MAIEAPGSGTVQASVGWVAQLLTGTVGGTIAVLAIAGVGLALLQGRLALREGARVVLGCFILFGSPILARALLDMADQSGSSEPALVYSAPPVPALPSAPVPTVFDPYAGASLPRQ